MLCHLSWSSSSSSSSSSSRVLHKATQVVSRGQTFGSSPLSCRRSKTLHHWSHSGFNNISSFLFSFQFQGKNFKTHSWMAAQNLSINDRHSHLVAIKVNDTTRCYQTPHCQSGQFETERDPIVRITWSMVNRWHNRRTMSSWAIIARWPENTSQYQNTRMFLQIFLLVQLTPRCCPCKKTCGRAPALPPSLCVNSCVNRRSWLKRKPLIMLWWITKW